MSTSWDKPPNPTTVIRPLSIFTPFFLWTSHLCCKDVFFSAAASCIESLFYSMCGCCGHFEAGSWHHLRICIYHYIVRWIFSFHTKVHSCFLIIWPFLMSVKQRGKKKEEERVLLGRREGTYLELGSSFEQWLVLDIIIHTMCHTWSSVMWWDTRNRAVQGLDTSVE